jgi:hypothetical protein
LYPLSRAGVIRLYYGKLGRSNSWRCSWPEADAGGYFLDSRPRGDDGVAAGFVSLYPPYNGFQAGSELAWTPVLPRGVQRGEAPLHSL